MYQKSETNNSILRELKIDTNNRLLPIIQRRIVKFFGHVIRKNGIKKLMIQGKIGKRKRGHFPNRFVDQMARTAPSFRNDKASRG